MQKLDLKKELGAMYRQPAGKISVVEVPPQQYLMVDGHGDPNSSVLFQDAIEALFSLSYTLKFMLKKQSREDYTVMPLEGLWWADDMTSFSEGNRDAWLWTLMILQPSFITNTDVEVARQQLMAKKEVILLPMVRLEMMDEGACMQILHIGSFSEEPPTIQKLHQFIKEQGYRLRGKHREIYLSDMRRTAPEKLKTIIRQPVSTGLE
jgi:hypothetical protein